MVLIFIYGYIGEIFKNFNGNMKLVVLMIALILYFLGTILWLILTSHGEYDKEGVTFGVMLIILYILFNHLQSLWGGLMIIILGFSFILLPSYLKKNWKIKRLYPWATLLIMLSVFLFGIMVVNEIYGEKTSDKISLYLNIDGNTSDRYEGNGTIECINDFNNKIFVGTPVVCKIIPPARVNSANATFVSLVGNLERQPIENLRLKIPYETSRLGFELNIINNQNVSYYVTTIDNYEQKIITKEKSVSNEERFILSLLALMGIIFFSVPAMMNSFKELNN